MRSRFLAVAAAVIAPGATLAAPAAALEPGVHVDPGSPAAKEYALPLSQARQTGGGSTSPGASETPFGVGIEPPKSGGSGKSGGGGTRLGHGSASSPPRSVSAAPISPAVRRAVAAADSAGGGASLPALIGGGVAILVLGGFGGTVLRHSRRPTPSA
jgi:hypothetical protein